ncbi:MAG: choice-of-anchor D domain-containing protein [Bacteroidetes bacterium]|nr:choice-of-anchor D domain-containing protein [Bacteroidota bacterium]
MKKVIQLLFICIFISFNSLGVARWVNNQGATRPATVIINFAAVATAPTTYTTIQSAIDAAVYGDFVYITNGEYRNPNEFTSTNCSLFGTAQDMGLYLHLNYKQNITITSETGDCCGSSARLVGYGFDFHAGNYITIQGLKIDSVRVNAFWNSNCCTHQPTSNVTIQNNYISNTRGHGIKTDGLEDYVRTSWNISNNYFENIGFYNGNGNCLTPAAVSAMWLSNPNQFTIQNNRIINTKWAGILCDGFTTVTIASNRVDNTIDAGIQIGVPSTSPFYNPGGANINNNTITNANTGHTLFTGAITLYPNNLSSISITNNDISTSFNGIAAGIAGWQNSLDTKNINNNNIYNLSPGSYGVTHILQTGPGGTGCTCNVPDNLNLYNLTNNYWGAATGPTYPTNPGGTGVALRKETVPQGGVIYSLNDFGFTPFLTSPATVYSINSTEINVQGYATSIADGDATPSFADSTNFGNAIVGGSETRIFTIQNTGTVTLGVSSITSSNALFTVSALSSPSPITPGNSASFNVTFSPTSAGLQSSTITINNDDCNEGVYNFDIQGTGTYTYTYSGSGDWTTAANWSPSYPGLTVGAGYTALSNSPSVIAIPAATTIDINGLIQMYAINNFGTLNLNAGSTNNISAMSNFGPINVVNGTTFNIPVGAYNDNSGSIVNSGLAINTGTVTNNGLITNNSGAIFTNNGMIAASGGGVFANNGTYKGIGAYNGALFSNPSGGIVAPGASPGCQTFGAGWTNLGTLSVEVNGLTACTDYDKLNVTGTATLNGILDLTISYTPLTSVTLTIIDADILSGTFTGGVTGLSSGWSVNYNTVDGNVELMFTPGAGAALHFDGTDDFVNINNLSATTNSNYTIEGWFKTSLTGAVQDIVSAHTLTNLSVLVVEVQLDGRLRFLHRVPAGGIGGTDIYSLSAVNDGNWHHFAAVHGADEMKLYIDGSLQAQSYSPVVLSPETINVLLGKLHDNSRYFQGSIDEIRFWNRALCVAEIQNNKNCEIATTGNGLIANYHFNHGAASLNNAGITSLVDATGNGNTGTLNNFALTGATSNWISPGGVSSGVNCAAYTTPEINVQGNSVTIIDGDATPDLTDHTDFGTVTVGNNLIRTFTIQNLGTADLDISSMSSNNSVFALSALSPASPIASGNSATFNVTFTPIAGGIQNSTITINNNDCDEAVYSFEVSGVGCIAPTANITCTNLICPGAQTTLNSNATLARVLLFRTNGCEMEILFREPTMQRIMQVLPVTIL